MMNTEYNYYKTTSKGLLKKVYGGTLKDCPLCGAPAVITEWNGIGDIHCRYNDNGDCPSIHYSGKWCITKAKAIRIWNNLTR